MNITVWGQRVSKPYSDCHDAKYPEIKKFNNRRQPIRTKCGNDVYIRKTTPK